MITGGCQCGAIRYRVERLGNASICHCRMCQKAFGNFYAPLATAKNLQWTRGRLSTFESSNKVTRGFCGRCGTPMSYDWGGDIEIAIATLDNPELASPTVQVNTADKLDFVDALHQLPVRDNSDEAQTFMQTLRSKQHPDHETENWPPES